MPSYNILYKPKGKAGEYCEGYALNLYDGCEHACSYCYAPSVRRQSKAYFFCNATPYNNVLKRLHHDLDKMVKAGDKQEVFMSFTSDPFQPIEEEYGITSEAMCLLERYGVPYRILTKAGYTMLEDELEFMDRQLCTLGSTLVFSKDAHSRMFESGAPVTSDRMNLLWHAHGMGFKTWVSLEPVWTREDAFALIKRTHEFVDEYKIGKLNYHPQAKNVDWVMFARDISEYCDELGVDYTLKEDLRKLLEVPE